MTLANRSALTQPSLPGILPTVVAEEELGLHRSGALWWPAERMLVVADLHLEKGSSYARRGNYLPPYDTAITLERLDAVINEINPARVIALGDSFHDMDAMARMPQTFRAMIAHMQLGREWVWVAGNHDPVIPHSFAGDTVDEIGIGPLVFRHEPLAGNVVGEVAAHLHPCARIRRYGRSIRRFCFAANADRIVLPAFGALTGGLNVLDEAWHPLFDKKRFQVHILGNQRIYSLAANKLIRD
ncbi:MAG: ligase-associated DNA damage response endonuclease PdeM [Stappiaceae bacterium]